MIADKINNRLKKWVTWYIENQDNYKPALMSWFIILVFAAIIMIILYWVI